MTCRLALHLVLVSLLAACGRPSEEPPRSPDEASRRTIASGELVGFEADGAHVWRGIPFAKPPVGELRWRAPLPPDPWEGTLEALAFGASCVQLAGPVGNEPGVEPGDARGSEDCLTLNVFAPAFAPDAVPGGEKRLPVMVWIHGGGNTIGDARVYDASRLAASQDVVVVTVHYRLGVFGWFGHASLRAGAGSDEDRSGNFGTLDLIRSLEWVRDHVAAFGGDPGNVTIFGESAGGTNVFSLLDSPRAAGLFHRAIAESGSVGSHAPAEHEDWLDDFSPERAFSTNEFVASQLVADGVVADRDAARAHIASTDPGELAAWLRAKSAADLLRPFAEGFGGMYRWPSVIGEGVVVRAGDDPIAAYETGDYNQVPVILGTNRDENRLFLAFTSEHVRRAFRLPLWFKDEEKYLRDAEHMSALWKVRGADAPARAMRPTQGPTVFAYRFDWDEEPRVLWLDFAKLLGAAHGLEIPFVFGRLDLGPANRFVFDEERKPAAERLSEQMMSYWTHFAATGDPARGRDGTLPAWTAWDESSPRAPRFLVLDTEADGGIRMSSDSLTRERVLARVVSDERFEGGEERCAFYRGMVGWNLSAEEYASIEGGACSPYPLIASE